MEIEYGSQKKISSPAELQIIINQCLTDDLRRQDYIDVVQDLLNFHGDAKKLARRINALEKDHSTIARMIIAQRLADRITDIPLPDRTTRGKRFSRSKYETFPIPASSVSHNSSQDSSCQDKYLQESMQWFQGLSKLACVLEMKGYKHDTVPPKIKITILDTGLDEKYRNKHPHGQYYDFISPTESSCQDLASHGTQMYQVLQKVYSEAEIYVGRVFETCEASAETADLMTQAIDHAATVWGVDIIVMPSGFENDHKGMLKKITKSTCNDKPVLFFAAAANSSNMKRVAFPARLYKRFRVISMFSTTAKNKPTPDFHPAPNKCCPFNLVIFGEHVVMDKAKLSGTSVSTIIGAGLAGRLLAFSHHPVNVGKILHLEDLRDTQGMSTVLKSMAIHENGYDCILPEKLLDGFDDSGAEDDPEILVDYVRRRIGSALATLQD
ncbi:peptidase S8/S53 domain-containing protein [Annulohypoxylon stygium]|nr:peptidase S8/S53 domain-containing protein [Annulohypoxylon stygium]